MKTTIIYGLYDPRKSKVIMYVGKGRIPDPAEHHWYDFIKYKGAVNKKLLKWFKKLKSKKRIPKFKVIEVVSISKWEKTERYWIKYWRKKNLNLCNITKGGYSYSPEAGLRGSIIGGPLGGKAAAKYFRENPEALKKRNQAIADWFRNNPEKAAVRRKIVAKALGKWCREHPRKFAARSRAASKAKTKWHKKNKKKSRKILAKARPLVAKWRHENPKKVKEISRKAGLASSAWTKKHFKEVSERSQRTGHIGARVACHNRWHVKKKIYQPKCSNCRKAGRKKN